MRDQISFEGEVTERQTLLDGSDEIVIEAAGEIDGEPWHLDLTARCPKQKAGTIDEASLTLTAASRGSVTGDLVSGSLETLLDEDTAAETVRLALSFHVADGDGAMAGATGTVIIAGPIEGDAVRLVAEVALTDSSGL